jgi:hypothetical protein
MQDLRGLFGFSERDTTACERLVPLSDLSSADMCIA